MISNTVIYVPEVKCVQTSLSNGFIIIMVLLSNGFIIISTSGIVRSKAHAFLSFPCSFFPPTAFS